VLTDESPGTMAKQVGDGTGKRRGEGQPIVLSPEGASLNAECAANVYGALDRDCDRDLVVWQCLCRGVTYWGGMFSLDHEQTGLIIDYCLGLCLPSGVEEAEELIARSDSAAELYSQVQAALAFLSYLPVEPCPDYLADLTVHRLCELAKQRAYVERPASGIIRVQARELVRNAAAVLAVAASILVFAGTLIPSFSSTRPHHYRQVPAEQLEKTSVNIDLCDSDYAWLPILDESPLIEFMAQVPGSSPGAPGFAEYNPLRVYPFSELGPQVLPASWQHHLEQPSQDHLMRSSPPGLSGQSR